MRKKTELRQEFTKALSKLQDSYYCDPIVQKVCHRISVGSLNDSEIDLGRIFSTFISKLAFLSNIEVSELVSILIKENIVLKSKLAETNFESDSNLQFMNIVGQLFEQVYIKVDCGIPGLEIKGLSFWFAKDYSIAELKNPVFNELRLLLELKRKLFHFLVKVRLILSKIAKVTSELMPGEFSNIQRHIADYETKKNYIKKTEVRYWNLLNALKKPQGEIQKNEIFSKKLKKLSSVKNSSRKSWDSSNKKDESSEPSKLIGINNYLSLRRTSGRNSALKPNQKLADLNMLGGFDGIQKDDDAVRSQNLDLFLKYQNQNIDIQIPLRQFKKPERKIKVPKKFKFLRFEQHDKKFSEYKGSLARFCGKLNAHNPLQRYSSINYELNSDEELSLLNAENCSNSREEIESEDDIVEDPEDKAFIVDDDYVSQDGEEKASKPHIRNRRFGPHLTELKPSCLSAEEIRKDVQLFARFAVINLAKMNYPIKSKI